MAPKYDLRYVTKEYPFMTCLVKVHTVYSRQKTLTRMLNKCQGIHSFRMNDDGLVEISGTVDPNRLLKILGKLGRKAELKWFQFGECSSNLYMSENGASPMPENGQDGRYLHSDNINRPNPPHSNEAPILDYANQCGYDHNNQDYQQHDYQDNYVNRTYYQTPLRGLPEDDMVCCRVM